MTQIRLDGTPISQGIELAGFKTKTKLAGSNLGADTKLDLESKKGIKTPLDEELEEYPIEYCLNQIRTDAYVWDMRCWNKYKDRAEVIAFLKQKDIDGQLNAGHVIFCIELLRDKHKVAIERIADAIMANPHILYKNRILKCWDDEELCPKYKKQGHFGNDLCKGCE